MVTIRVPTRSNRHRKDHARGFIMAYRLRPPHPAGWDGAGSGGVPGGADGAAGGPAETAGDPAPAGVAGLGRGRRGGGRARRAAGDRAGRGGLGPGGAGRARLPHQPADRAAHRAVGVHAGPAAGDAGPRRVRGRAVIVPGGCSARSRHPGRVCRAPAGTTAREGTEAEEQEAQAAGRRTASARSGRTAGPGHTRLIPGWTRP